MVAAYLCICNELGFRPRYASEKMLFQLSDNCIRDFLAQMDGLYIRRRTDIDNFVAARIPPDEQDQAFRAVSTSKHDFILSSGVSSPNETRWLVDALGELTARLQSGPTIKAALQSTERGVFVLKLPPDNSLRSVKRVIQEAGEAGFLKLLKAPSGELRFRVHCSLAPFFGFSYRGSYYPVQLQGPILESIYQETSLEKRNELISRLVVTFNEAKDNLTLFGNRR